MTDNTIHDHADPLFTEERVDEAFRDGAAAMREMLARFVEQMGDTATASSIRLNWHPGFGTDPGQVSGELPISAWGMTQEMHDRALERVNAAIAKARP
jgi:hypothetical protein